MKKIMFNDQYGLTQAVLEGRKTQTRRILRCPRCFGGKYVSGFRLCTNREGIQFAYLVDEDEREIEGSVNTISAYQIGEEVAIAQRYSECNRAVCFVDTAGWNNKMFVNPYIMPHRIKITNIRIERLQDISEEDCLKEGIKRKNERYVVENEKGVCFYTNDVILAFRSLIDKICGKGTWESNPYVFVYDFELIK
jgi:hypothetical protein